MVLDQIWDGSSSLGLTLSLIRVVGLFKLLEVLYRLLQMARRNLRDTSHLADRYGKGSWAVVTGGSDGIGLAMAKELARRNFNIVIVARSESKMKEAAEIIKKAAPKKDVQVRCITFDFTKTDHSVAHYQEGIVNHLSDLDISILINNAGYMVPGDFERITLEEHKQMIDVGIMPATMLTKLLTESMLTRGKRSAVVFVTSVQAQAPVAGTGTYGSSKVYLDYLSKALSHEHRQHMDVMTFQCGLVNTKFIGFDPKRKPTLYQKLFCITPEQAAERSLADLGHEFWTHGHFKHDIYALFYRTMAQTWFLQSFFNRSASAKANHANERLKKKAL